MFVTTPATPAAPGQDGEAIKAGYFWPDISPAAAREAMRLNGTVTGMRLRHALVEAIASVNSELADWRVRQVATGYSSLQAVPSEEVDGQSILVARWVRAVYATAAADLYERYRGFDTTGKAEKRADEEDCAADDLRRDARLAIRAILGVTGGCIVELI
jgi:hypothetical protein